MRQTSKTIGYMKKLVFIFIATVLLGTSCKKQPIQGPQGPAGKDGKDGVVEIYSNEVTVSAWDSLDAYTWFYDDYDPSFGTPIANGEVVTVKMLKDNGSWVNLNWTDQATGDEFHYEIWEETAKADGGLSFFVEGQSSMPAYPGRRTFSYRIVPSTYLKTAPGTKEREKELEAIRQSIYMAEQGIPSTIQIHFNETPLEQAVAQ